MANEKKAITEEYQEFVKVASKLADGKYYSKKERDDEFSRHLIGMLEMYQIRYGDPEERLLIVNFLERQLFRAVPIEEEVSHLTYDMWKDLRKSILAGEYNE